jgi:hypothetical protein
MKCPTSWIFVDIHVTSQQGRARNTFILTTTDHFALKIILRIPLEISTSLKTFKTSTNQYLVSNEYFYMVNPCCDRHQNNR